MPEYRTTNIETSATLLGEYDPFPVELVDGAGAQPGLLVCEHAGNAVPQQLGKLGLPDTTLQLHIAYDIGAAATARLIAAELRVPLILQRYSRLVIDCNRPPDAFDSMPAISHGTAVPGNANIDDQQKKCRVNEIFNPFDQQIGKSINSGVCQWAFSIHSFTPELNGVERPWDIGFLYREDTKTSAKLAAAANNHYPDLTVGLNQPYQVDDESDWFVPQHAERRGLMHSLIEIRNDHIETTAGQQKWASIVSELISSAIEQRAESPP